MSKTSQAVAQQNDASTYDDVPYENSSHPLTHPDQMAVIGSLFGLSPAKLETARVLELGGAGGGNLIPLALRYPKAHFTGMDLSQRQIDFAIEQETALGLDNVDFRQQDIMSFDLQKNKGAFDYIICHGVYSWAPAEVGARILELCRECLSDNGLAVISYNTLPGWNAVRSLREMMLYHSRKFPAAADKIKRSRELLDYLAENATPDNGYKALIEGERALLHGRNDSYLYHDHLESVNRQFYFHEFHAELQRCGLAYVGDSSLSTMHVGNLPQKVQEAVKGMTDLVEREQYIDFVYNRRFRTSIICKHASTLNRDIPPEKILGYCLTTTMVTAEPSPDFSKPVQFVTADGKGSFTAHKPLAAITYHEIIKSGIRPISIDTLAANVRKRLPEATPDSVRGILISSGVQFALGGVLLLHMNSPAFAGTLGEKPVASPFARLQASKKGCKSVTTLLGNMVSLDGLACKVVSLMDGTRTLDDIVAFFVADALSGKISLEDNGQVIRDKAALTAKLKEMVSGIAGYLAQQAVLER